MYVRVDQFDDVDESTDQHLLTRWKMGDEGSLDCLIRQHSDALFHYCCRLTRNRHDAEDICQETLARAVSRIDSLQNGPSFRWWLFRIAKNLSVDNFRVHSRNCALVEEDLPPESLHDGPYDHLQIVEEHSTVVEAMSELTESHRRVLVLREVEGLSYTDIARRLKVSHSAVETLLYRARRRLREEYGKRDPILARLAALGGIRGIAGRLIAPVLGGPAVGAKIVVGAVVVGSAAVAAPHVWGGSSRAHMVQTVRHVDRSAANGTSSDFVPARFILSGLTVPPMRTNSTHAQYRPNLHSRSHALRHLSAHESSASQHVIAPGSGYPALTHASARPRQGHLASSPSRIDLNVSGLMIRTSVSPSRGISGSQAQAHKLAQNHGSALAFQQAASQSHRLTRVRRDKAVGAKDPTGNNSRVPRTRGRNATNGGNRSLNTNGSAAGRNVSAPDRGAKATGHNAGPPGRSGSSSGGLSGHNGKSPNVNPAVANSIGSPSSPGPATGGTPSNDPSGGRGAPGAGRGN